jgi:hypothetical protein
MEIKEGKWVCMSDGEALRTMRGSERARDGVSVLGCVLHYSRLLFASALPTAPPRRICLVVFWRLIKVQLWGCEAAPAHEATA